LWPFIGGILLIFWGNAVYNKMQKQSAMTFFDGILTIRKLHKEYVYDVKEFISFKIMRDSEGTDSLYGVYLKDGKMKKKTLCYDVYEIGLKTIQEYLNEYIESYSGINDLEKEQQEREIRIILNNSISSIMLLISTMMNFVLAFTVLFTLTSLFLATLSLIVFTVYNVISRKIVRNNTLGKVFLIISAILMGSTFINFFLTMDI
jgi:hypothetical protein